MTDTTKTAQSDDPHSLMLKRENTVRKLEQEVLQMPASWLVLVDARLITMERPTPSSWAYGELGYSDRIEFRLRKIAVSNNYDAFYIKHQGIYILEHSQYRRHGLDKEAGLVLALFYKMRENYRMREKEGLQ